MVGVVRRFARKWFLPSRLKKALPEEVLEASNHLARMAPPSMVVAEEDPVLKTSKMATHALDWLHRLRSVAKGKVTERDNNTQGVFTEKIRAGKITHEVTLGHLHDLGLNQVERNVLGEIASEVYLGNAVAKRGWFSRSAKPAGIAINRVTQLISSEHAFQMLLWNERKGGLAAAHLKQTVDTVKRELGAHRGPDPSYSFEVRDGADGSATVHYGNATDGYLDVGSVEAKGLKLTLGHPPQYKFVSEALINAVFADAKK